MIARRIRSAIARYVAFWNQREAPTSLACVRILFAAAVFVDLGAAWPLGALPIAWAQYPDGVGWSASDNPPLIAHWLGASPTAATIVWGVALIAALAVLFGAYYRVASWLLVFATLDLMAFTSDGDAIDNIFHIVLPLLALSDANAAFSFDAWRRKRAGKPPPLEIAAWPRYLIVLQLLWVYFSAAHHRGGASWRLGGNFTAIADVLCDPHFARFAPGSLAFLFPLTQLGTLLTMTFELSSPLYPLLDYLQRHPERGGRLASLTRRLRLRNVWLALGVGLHLGIAFTMQLGIFPFGILALYPALIHPAELSRALARGAEMLGRARRQFALG